MIIITITIVGDGFGSISLLKWLICIYYCMYTTDTYVMALW